MIIEKELIDEIRSRVNIVDVIGSYIPLIKKGRGYEAICPFHDDHDPSLKVSQEKQIYTCFVCGNSGNVFNFVMNYEEIGFKEAVAKVAEFAGISLDEKYFKNDHQVKIDPKKQRNSDLLKDLIQYTQYELQSVVAQKHLAYLKERKITKPIIEKFEIGYNPTDDKAAKFLKLKGYQDDEIVASGVANFANNQLYDFFKDRITIPIHDINGLCVGFTARTIDPNNQAKYINTAETNFYHKRDLLFNYHRAKELVKKQKEVIVCEGAMDVIGLAKADINNAVATLGTACSEQQIKLLKFLKAKVKVFYDGDDAGQKATYKLGKLAHKHYLNIEVINNISGKDPDEIFMEHGKEELLKVCDMTMSYMEFLLHYLPKYKYNLHNFSDMKAFVEEIAEELEYINDDMEKKLYIDKVKQLTGYDLSDFHPKSTTASKPITKPKQENKSALVMIQERIIQLLMLSKQGSEIFNANLGFLPNPTYQSLALKIIDYYRDHECLQISEFIDMIEDDKTRNIVIRLAEDEEVPKAYDEQFLIEAIDKLKRILNEEQESKLTKQIVECNDVEKKRELLAQLQKIKRR